MQSCLSSCSIPQLFKASLYCKIRRLACELTSFAGSTTTHSGPVCGALSRRSLLLPIPSLGIARTGLPYTGIGRGQRVEGKNKCSLLLQFSPVGRRLPRAVRPAEVRRSAAEQQERIGKIQAQPPTLARSREKRREGRSGRPTVHDLTYAARPGKTKKTGSGRRPGQTKVSKLADPSARGLVPPLGGYSSAEGGEKRRGRCRRRVDDK